VKGVNSFERILNPEEAQRMGYNQVLEGIYFNKYPIGVAVLLLPFFLLGHIFTLIFREETNGWSFFYQYMVSYGGIVYFLAGISILKRLLLRHFSSIVTLITLIITIFGTNLFNYATYENAFSHIYSFLFITLLLFITPMWLKKFDLKKTIIMGIVCGFILLIRQMNVIFLLIPLLYGLRSLQDIGSRIITFWKVKWKVMLILGVIVLLFLPQIAYWKYASGSWITFSYVGESFTFTKPLILKVLFSTQKGLFFWSPLLLFASFGLFLLKGSVRKYIITAVFIITLQIYLVSCWSNWQFGWSYGHRVFVDSMPFFALGFAGFYSGTKNKKYFSIVVYALSGMLLFLSLFQMVQYWLKIIPPINTTFDEYRNIFLLLDSDKQFHKQDKLY